MAVTLLVVMTSALTSLAVEISSNALQQISALIGDKATWTAAQTKLDSQLIYALRASRNQPIAPGVTNLQFLPAITNGQLEVDIVATVSPALLDYIQQNNGSLINSFSQFRAIRARIPLPLAEQLAARADVVFVRPADQPRRDTGSIDTEGDITQTAQLARSTFGVDGSGVKVGVLSDSVDFLNGSIASGDLPPNVTILPGQSGVPSTGEGTAMLEIVHDIAPGAQLFFATANGGTANFAQNILNLRSAGCDVIVDDIRYATEPTLQDGDVARAVNSVTADGALYFASAGNSGNKAHGTSGTWEGDFADGGPAGTPVNGRQGTLHAFASGATSDPVTGFGGGVLLNWADPLGASTNDYDLFVLDSNGTTVLGASTTAQTGTQDPLEGLFGNLAPGLLVVVVKVSGDDRFLHLDSLRGQLQFNTTGFARGHSAATNAFSTAAVDVATSFPNAFVGGAQNNVESFSSDGPRRMFFQQDGTPITPGNFSSTGGAVRQYPTIAASDGVSTAVPGFSPFFGTSAAAPHAAAICALLKSYNPTLSPDDVRNVLTSTALDIEAPGLDITGGYGIVMALPALRAAPLGVNLVVLTNTLSGGNGNGVIDNNECNDLDIVLVNRGVSGATNIQATLSTTTPGVIVAQRTSAYPDIPAAGTGTNFVHYKISTAPTFLCGTPVDLSLVVKSDEGSRTNHLQLASGTNGLPVRFNNFSPTNIPDNNLAGVSSPIVVSNVSGAIANVSVSLFITHTFDADLSLELIGPDGTTAVLSANNGSSGDNYGINCTPDSSRTTFSDSATTPISAGAPPFVGTFKPDGALSVFNGKSGTNVNGTWNLHIVDGAAIDVGTLQCWSLTVSPPGCVDGGGQCPGVDLSIGITAAPEPVFVGSNLVYTIRVTNAGPDTAKSTVISQLLPPSVIFVSAAVSQGTIGQAGGVVTANPGNIPAGGVIVATVVVAPTTAGLISSTASVTSNNPEFDPSNNSATAVSHVNPPFADLALGIDAAPNPALVNQTLAYTVSVTNRGPSAASGTVISNLLPASVGILSVTPSQGSATVSGNVVLANLGTLASGTRATLTILVNPTLEGTIVASASATANQSDPVLQNNSASVSTVIGPATDLSVGLSATPNPVVLRSNVTYTINVTNSGPSTATSVVVNNILPTGVTLVSSNTTAGSISVSGTTVTCSIGAMANGATATITLVIRTINAGTLVDSVNVSGAQSDPNTVNNSASISVTVAAPFVSVIAAGATLTAESFAPANGTVDVGENVTMQLRLRNTGNVANTNLVATLLAINGVTAPSGPQTYGILAPSGFPVGKSFTFTADGTNGGVVQATLSLQDISGTVTNNLGTATFSFNLPSVATFSNTNRIDIPTTLQDQQQAGPAAPYPSPILVSGVSGLVGKVTATLNNVTHSYPHDINVLLVDSSGTSTLLMSHSGDASSLSGADLTFDDSAEAPLPASGQILAGSYRPSAYAPSPTFTNPAPTGPYSTALSVFNGPAANGTWSLFVNDDSDGDFGNIAGGWTLSLTTVTPVNQVADLAASAISTPATVLVGSLLTNTFNLVNNGPNAVATAAFTNTIPVNASLISATVSQGAIVTNGNTLLFNLGALASGSNAIVRVILSPTSAGSVSNPGVIASASGETDLNPANNSITALANAVLPQTDIGIGLTATPNPVVTGSNFTTSITVSNLGTNNALNVVVSNTLPAGVSFVSASASQGSAANLGGTVVGTLGTIPAGGVAAVNFTVTATAAGSLTNVARVSTLSIDGNSSNDSATLVVNVANAAPVILAAGANLVSESIVPANAAIDPGETVTVSLTLTNAGQLDAANLVATLLAANGVNSPSGPVTYGPLVHGGAAVSRNFTFTSQSASGTGVVATLQLQDGANNLGTVSFAFAFPTTTSFTNSFGIVVPDHGPATPYPSTISVSGLTGVVSKVAITLNGFSHSFPHDVNVLLVNPAGQKVTALAHTGGGHAVTNLNITLDDSALLTLSEAGALTTGEFKPASFAPAAAFPPPAPAGVPAATLSAFNGASANGTWSLYVLDDSAGDAGTISGGWSLSITTVNPIGPVVNLIATATGTPNPVYVGALLTYRLTLTNSGPSTATGVLFTDTLPPGVTLVSSNTTSGSFSLFGGGVTINVGSLAPGAGLVATLGVVPSVAGGLENLVTATSAQTDIDPVSNTAKVLTTAISPTAAQLSIIPIANGQYQITLTGDPGQAYVIQGATNFVNWVPVVTGTAAANGTFKFNTTNAQTFNYRFFRSVRLP